MKITVDVAKAIQRRAVKHTPMTQQEEAAWLRSWLKGMTLKAGARKYGRSATTLQAAVNRYRKLANEVIEENKNDTRPSGRDSSHSLRVPKGSAGDDA